MPLLLLDCRIVDLEERSKSSEAEPSPKRLKLNAGSPVKPALVAKPGQSNSSAINVDDREFVKIEIEAGEVHDETLPPVSEQGSVNDELYKGKSPDLAPYRRRLIRAVANVYKFLKHSGTFLVSCLLLMY
jgi:hypothetical protein